MYNILNDAFRWVVSTSIKVVPERFSLAHRFSDIVYLYISRHCDIENVGQAHDVQHVHWRLSMSNINLYNSRS